jgi:phospholipid transport system substrate-binding protein
MNTLLKSILIITLALLTPALAQQTQAQELREMMVQKSDTFFDILRNKNLDEETRKQKVLDVIGPLFDFKLMSRLALNKKIWKSLNREDRKEFSDVFVSRVQRSYLSKLDIFADVEVEIGDSVQIKKNRIEVTALMKTKADTKKIVYKFYLSKQGKWLIYDVSVVGVSFLQSYRSQYASYLKEHSFEELLNKLKDSDIKEDADKIQV